MSASDGFSVRTGQQIRFYFINHTLQIWPDTASRSCRSREERYMWEGEVGRVCFLKHPGWMQGGCQSWSWLTQTAPTSCPTQQHKQLLSSSASLYSSPSSSAGDSPSSAGRREWRLLSNSCPDLKSRKRKKKRSLSCVSDDVVLLAELVSLLLPA